MKQDIRIDQLESLINAATEQVAREGMAAPDKMVLLAGLGYLAQKIDRANGYKNGRKAVVVKLVVPAAAWSSIGVAAMAVLDKLVK